MESTSKYILGTLTWTIPLFNDPLRCLSLAGFPAENLATIHCFVKGQPASWAQLSPRHQDRAYLQGFARSSQPLALHVFAGWVALVSLATCVSSSQQGTTSHEISVAGFHLLDSFSDLGTSSTLSLYKCHQRILGFPSFFLFHGSFALDTCEALPDKNRRLLYTDGLNYRTVAYCKPGYHSLTQHNGTCKANGLWEGEPNCAGECWLVHFFLDGPWTSTHRHGHFLNLLCHDRILKHIAIPASYNFAWQTACFLARHEKRHRILTSEDLFVDHCLVDDTVGMATCTSIKNSASW